MLTLKRLKVRGFRGFRGDEAFDFGHPATLLFGGNHYGKSSTLNAVEWALFGDECAGEKTGIRERVRWQIANHHMGAPDVLAEVELDGLGGTYLVRRTLKKPPRKSAVPSLELTLPDGEVLTGDEAKWRLAHLLGSSFRDFMTTVYQHQEAIRAVLTQQAQERNDAIDRLLGLSDYRNLLDAVKDADAKGWHKKIFGKFQAFESRVDTARMIREKDLEVMRQEAADAGVSEGEINEEGALRNAAQVRQALVSFAGEACIEVTQAELPRTWKDLEAFEKATGAEINRLRGALPDFEEQKKLFSRQSEVGKLKNDIEKTRGFAEEIGRSTRELDKRHGSQQAVDAQTAEVKEDLEGCKRRLGETSARAKLIQEAIEYLEEANDPASRCPLCEAPAPDLLQGLRRLWQETLRSQVAATDEEITSLNASLDALEEAAGKYNDWNKQLSRHAARLTRYREQTGELLGQPLIDRDDPVALLTAELSRIDRRLGELNNAVDARQNRLDGISEELKNVRLIREVLQWEEKTEFIKQIKESPEYRDVEDLRDQAAELVADIEGIKDAINAVSNEEAQDKLSAAEATIDQFFRRLTRHPAVTRFRLAVRPDTRTGRNSYNLTDQDDKDLAPVLSQGDLNALALAMFLGLACSAEGTGAFGFVMLDDPSQSLGTEHKEQLVAVLNEVAASKKLLLATMDREFRDRWCDGITRAKAEYLFEDWTPENGPSISRR
jgi:DNA repair exonuclease SbcCD ATPase subunit